jgi:nitrate reductase molybdenum cofactor assembly chaperone
MDVQAGIYTALAGLLAYPDGDFRRRLARCRELLGRREGDAGRSPVVPTENDSRPLFWLAEFDAATRGCELTDLEELYTRTFDFSPACALEIGWHLFGEDYHRGALLVRLREELARHGIQESCELPDHLTHVLPLLDRMLPDEAARFARACVTPAVEKMLAGLDGKQNPYASVLHCLVVMLDTEFGGGACRGNGLPAQEERPPGRSRYDAQELPHEPAGIS